MILERQVELLLLARILDATENMDFFYRRRPTL